MKDTQTAWRDRSLLQILKDGLASRAGREAAGVSRSDWGRGDQGHTYIQAHYPTDTTRQPKEAAAPP